MGPRVRIVASVRVSTERPVERGFSLEDLMQALGRLELDALGQVKPDHVPPPRPLA